MLFYRGQDFSIERAIIAFCNLFHLFQELNGKPDRERFCYFFLLAYSYFTANLAVCQAARTPVPRSETRNGYSSLA
jgi:hypothetical protein